MATPPPPDGDASAWAGQERPMVKEAVKELWSEASGDARGDASARATSGGGVPLIAAAMAEGAAGGWRSGDDGGARSTGSLTGWSERRAISQATHE
eukprot:1704531-Prymnesium_polylepis.1